MLQQKISKYYSYRLLNNSSNDLLSDSFWAGRFQNTVHGKRVTGIGCTAKPTFTLVALMRPMPRAGLYGIYYFIYNIAYFIYLLSTVNGKRKYISLWPRCWCSFYGMTLNDSSDSFFTISPLNILVRHYKYT